MKIKGQQVNHWVFPKEFGVDNLGNKIVITEYKDENGKTITTTEKIDNKIVEIKTENTTIAISISAIGLSVLIGVIGLKKYNGV